MTESSDLLKKRLFFITGKGGTGKSSIAVALALAMERLNKTVLLVEVGDADTISQIFQRETLPAAPQRIGNSIWGARVNPEEELTDYIHKHVKIKLVAKRITKSKLFDHIAMAVPGLSETMTLGKIWRWEQETGEHGRPEYDTIIVDGPSTGHSQTMLRIPPTVINMLRIGPIVEQMRKLERLLQDESKMCLVVATLPEDLPVNETIEFQNEMTKEPCIPISAIIVNCMYPKVFAEQEIQELKRAIEANPNQGKASKYMLDAAIDGHERRIKQEIHLERIQQILPGKVVEFPYFFANDLQTADLTAMADLFKDLLKKA